jgi:diguanylate cyclase (GGDEF)-like protein/putative nucleotidyltransferase with HDIG domain
MQIAREAGDRSRRPRLLALVLGSVLVLVGVTASALMALTSGHLTKASLTVAVDRDAALAEYVVTDLFAGRPMDLQSPDRSDVDDVTEGLAALTRAEGLLRVEIRSLDGRVIYSDAPAVIGLQADPSAAMADARGGDATAVLVEEGARDSAAGDPLGSASVVEEYLPILDRDREPVAVVAMWRDVRSVMGSMGETLRDVMLITLGAGLVLATLLFLVFRAAQARLSRQHDQILEATRRDALTGMLNHGTIVTTLADEVERARDAGGRIGVAILDVDNFRLFNETHGHDAADEVLLRVAGLVRAASVEGDLVARYGPDEFLFVRPGADAAQMEAAIARLRADLADLSVQFGDSERLPISISAGICAYPQHAGSVTDLLTEAAVAVAEAKASGGDQVCVARTEEEREEAVVGGSFDVLQGLVIAVDTKDRYTKRHSEDVARYAVFLAERLGLDEELHRTIHLAGLLHDVGKIGIPDGILRKPSKLTAEEYGVFQQHVALGDAIVRDVPNVDVVREGIRHHHERWDGNGYLEGLEGEEIPVIARVLAVADAFSAMTTTRPYRKALPVEEALKRLGDAAGSQLQEDFVAAFIQGIETAADAPLPGDEPITIWRPELWVA